MLRTPTDRGRRTVSAVHVPLVWTTGTRGSVARWRGRKDQDGAPGLDAPSEKMKDN